MNYVERIAGEQRLLVLQALKEDTDYTVNDIMLQAWLDQFGMALSLDKLRTELQWLSEQGLVEIDYAAHLHIAKLTSRGLDVAQGRSQIPGIARPRPE